MKNSELSEVYHEILFGLIGVQKSFLYDASLKEFLSKSEQLLLDRIADIGEKYCQLSNFIKRIQCDKESGFYALKFVELLDKCLEPYRLVISDLESQKPCLTSLYSRIYPYSEILTALVMLTQELTKRNSRGCAILEVVDCHLNLSTRLVQTAISYIYQGLSQLLLNHLQSWLLYGEITDSKLEFFVQRNNPQNSSNPFTVYHLDYSLVPSVIRPTVAERILNIGQTVLFFRSRPATKSRWFIKEQIGSTDNYFVDSSGIKDEKASEISSMFKEATQAVPSDKWKFLEQIAETVASLVTTQLHSVAMINGGLVQQLHNIKNVFLMGRGELFHELVTQLDNIVKGSPGFIDINVLLRHCARKVLLHEDMLEPFSMEMKACEGGPILKINYSVPWPLELLFTAEVIELYNCVFRFLLRLKRIQVRLVAAWLRDKSKRRFVSCAKRRQLQQNLWFLVNNLQYYLQVDVLESQFVALETLVVASDNFDDVRLAHSNFLANLTVQSFLEVSQSPHETSNPVQQRINNILILCEEYCCQNERVGEGEMPTETVEGFTMKFDSCFQRLFALLEGLKKHAGHPGCQHLGQLLLRLDFNGFFSQRSQGIV